MGQIKVAPSRLPHTADDLLGRDNELQRLTDAWNDPAVHVVTIVAWGGVGKTSLVDHWQAGLAPHDYDGADYFDWSFYSQGTREQGAASADSFIAAALAFFGDPGMAKSATSPWYKGARLAELIGQRRCLLVLDGLEPLQHPPASPLAGQLKDPALTALLKGLAAKNSGLCVVTTRERLADLAPFRNTTAPEWQLEHLSVPAGIELLKKLGVWGVQRDFEQLVKDVKGHALTLDLLGRYLAEAHSGDIRKRSLVKFDEASAEEQGGHAFRVMGTYEKWFASGGAKGQRLLAVLRLLGLFDRPAEAGCLAALRRAPDIPGLTGPLMRLTDPQWNLAVNRLAACGLVAIHKPNSLQPSLDAHPLVREYFAKQLLEQNPEAWREGHLRLYGHLSGAVPASTPASTATLDEWMPLCRAVFHGCQAGIHQEVKDNVYMRYLRHRGAGVLVRQFGAVSLDLQLLANFFNKPWLAPVLGLDSEFRANVPGMAATRLGSLLRLDDAIHAVRKSVALCSRLPDKKHVALRARHYSELLLLMGEVKQAIKVAEEAVVWSDKSEDISEQIAERSVLAHALHQNGREREAEQRFKEAEVLQQKSGSGPSVLPTLWGFRYCDLLQARHRWAEVFDRTQRLLRYRGRADTFGLGILDKPLYKLAQANCLLNWPGGASPQKLAALSKLFTQAIDGIRSSGKLNLLPLALLGRAEFYLRDCSWDEADRDLAHAELLATGEGGRMRLYQTDILLLRAWSALARAKREEAREFYHEARKLVDKTGYHRRDQELAKLKHGLSYVASRSARSKASRHGTRLPRIP